MNVVIGTNRFADASIEVGRGHQIGFRSKAQPNTHRQPLGGNVASLEFEIDGEGTFTRVSSP